jgi:hypothetical protein
MTDIALLFQWRVLNCTKPTEIMSICFATSPYIQKSFEFRFKFRFFIDGVTNGVFARGVAGLFSFPGGGREE